MTPRETLVAARALLIKRGWTQWQVVNAAGEYCVSGAIAKICGEPHITTAPITYMDKVWPAAKLLAEALNPDAKFEEPSLEDLMLDLNSEVLPSYRDLLTAQNARYLASSPMCNLINYNDHHCRSLSEMLALFDKALI